MLPKEWANTKPESFAAIDSDTGSALTWAEFAGRVNRLCHHMRSVGLVRGDHVAVFLENRLEYFEAVWAALLSGLYVTPISRHLGVEEAGYILGDCQAKLLITSEQLADTALRMVGQAVTCSSRLIIGRPRPGFASYEESISNFPSTPIGDPSPGALMFYSSGTTGKPKGILRSLSATSVENAVKVMDDFYGPVWSIDSNTVYLSPAPLYHAAPLSFVVGVLSAGGTVVMMTRFDETEALRSIEKYRVTHSQWVPTMFNRLLKLDDQVKGAFDLSSHQMAIHAGAPCPVEIKRRMFDWWGPIVHEYYGGSENIGMTLARPEEWLKYPGTVGKPIIGSLKIYDDSGDELPQGETGLIYFQNDAGKFEYHGAPEKTKESRHPTESNSFALGDMGYVNEQGFLFLTDRKNFTIISGGVNIYPREIEDMLVIHPKVMDVAVIGVPNSDMGEEVRAVVQLEAGIPKHHETSQELIDYVRGKLAHYKCPRSIDFVDELPRLPNGKLYKRLIRDRYWSDTELNK